MKEHNEWKDNETVQGVKKHERRADEKKNMDDIFFFNDTATTEIYTE